LKSGTDAKGLACVCLAEKGCDGRWPTRFFNGFSTPANLFECHKMTTASDGSWHVIEDSQPPQWAITL